VVDVVPSSIVNEVLFRVIYDVIYNLVHCMFLFLTEFTGIGSTDLDIGIIFVSL
jgi:hypothetical protein